MSEPHEEPRKEPATIGDGAAPPQVTVARGWRTVAIVLAVALPLVVGLAATSVLFLYGQPWTPPPEPQRRPAESPRPPREPQRQPPEAAASPALQELERRVAGLEARPAVPPGDLAEIRQEVAKLAASTAEMTARIDSVDKEVRSQAASGPTDIALVLALLQIRDAIEVGRPFAAAYDALVGLAQGRPEIAAAAAPLAGSATAGLPGRPVLASRLRELADAIAAADASETPAAATDRAASDWAGKALRRLSGLVTIRRIDGAGQGQEGGGPPAVLNAALRALAGGDLEGAVGALDKLTGAPAETVRPWLRMAKERLAAEAALQQIEALLAARLGTPANSPAGPPR
jgi:hypothetical protein